MAWDPEKYLKFSAERFQPFEDLCAMLDVRQDLRVVDLGCGSGELTEKLAALLPNCEMLGIDNSPEMLEKAKLNTGNSICYKCQTIEDFIEETFSESGSGYDLIFSNAALHWVDDHNRIIPALAKLLNPNGQILWQFPSGERNPAHKYLAQVATEEPYYSALNGWEWHFPVLKVEQYAHLLHHVGAKTIEAVDRVYCHLLVNADAVYDFTAGTSMLPYLERMPRDLHQQFCDRYRELLRGHFVGSLVLFTFRRILISAKF